MKQIDSVAMAGTFAARTDDELRARYKVWADTYDAENAAAGFRLPYLCSAFLARHVPASAGPVLDAGCGTGLGGDCLAILGYRDLAGLDMSEPMLAHAARRGIYASLHCMALGRSLDLPPHHFAAVLASGVFTEGHAPVGSFDELIRITRPGGCLVFSVRDDLYENDGFGARFDEIEALGFWRLRERSERCRSFAIKEPDVFARIFVYEALQMPSNGSAR